MSPETSRLKVGRTLLCTLVLASALLVCGRNAFADDRELLRASVKEPYVFILLDTSGSMHWSPKCTQAQYDAGECGVVCPTGDCFVPMNGDDPDSKLFQAKEALYEVIKGIDNVQFGFATYNQDQAYMRTKHYLYRAKTGGPVIPGYGAFPAANSQDVLGMVWSCTSSDSTGCAYNSPADTTDAWEMNRIRRVPKAGISLASDVTVWIRHSGNIYRVKYHPVSGTYGSDVRINIDIDRCTSSSSCGTAIGQWDVDFAYVNEFGSWDNGAGRTNPTLGYFDQGASADTNASNTCSGWDPTTDTASDRYNGYSLRFPTITDPRGSFFDSGDVIPLDWNNRHQQDILNRLAPNVVADVNATPDFRTAFYFKNARTGTDTFLRLKDEAQRPLMAAGSTPLGNSVKAFRTWWAGCSTATDCTTLGGWEKVAKSQDTDFPCRRKFLLVLTDGDETCSGDPCGWTEKLFNYEGIKTFVVAFGIQNQSGNALNCMATKGGSGAPIYPQNKQELIDALTNIFSQIQEEASAFASAAVPSVQAEVADRIFLSSFTPLNGESVWDGHLDAYLKPLPLTTDGKPARSIACPPDGSTTRSSCHLWDAGVEMVAQAPERSAMDMASSLSGSVLKIGSNPTERRVFYAKQAPASGIGRDLRLLIPPPTTPTLIDPDWTDIWAGFNIPVSLLNLNAAKTRTEDIIKQTLQIKDSQIEKADGTIIPIRYVLGDIFHSDPAIIDRPSEFGFYASDLFGTGSTSCTSNPGYRCWADKHKYRRKMLVVGSNDSQLHVFDGGVWDPTKKKFGDGSGRELFSYIPRLAMPVVRDLAESSRQIFGIDSTSRLDDVFIDPKHTGTPTATDREWRTIVLGGFREGGKLDAGGGNVDDFTSGYYALDVTQPDQLQANKTPIDTRIVPSCLTQDNSAISACGTLPFPGLLWEFTDSIGGSRLDEDDTNSNGIPDGNSYADLGQTWSVPTIGRIRVKEGSTQTYKFVAIFGGGLDPVAANKTSPKSGNWLYMVDIETGQAIYKRQLPGAVPSDPAVLDTDLDGYLDTIYIGTTAGYLYKVDISAAADLVTTTLSRNLMIPHLTYDPQVKRIQGWTPFPIFNTLGKPIYFAPTAFYISKISRFALAFGTGDREDLWADSAQEGRFYLIVDDNFTSSDATLPKDETKYKKIESEDAPQAAGSDFVINPTAGLQRGWYLRLNANERIITQAFGLSGIVIFSGYTPNPPELDPNSGVCSRGGDSRIFVVYANNADAIMTIYDPDTPTAPGVKSRSRTVPEFVTNPYVEQGATKNPGDNSTPTNSEQLDTTQQQIMEALKQFCPPESKFANYWISVSGIRSDTGYERYATVPICIVERHWKEH